MLVTERQARSMWCPFVHVRVGTGRSANRVNPGIRRRLYFWLLRTFFPNLYWFLYARYYSCTASKCMMWRWENDGSPQGFCGLMVSQMHIGTTVKDTHTIAKGATS
jgi:hypothetical protein